MLRSLFWIEIFLKCSFSIKSPLDVNSQSPVKYQPLSRMYIRNREVLEIEKSDKRRCKSNNRTVVMVSTPEVVITSRLLVRRTPSIRAYGRFNVQFPRCLDILVKFKGTALNNS
jgi:hypothetical protein